MPLNKNSRKTKKHVWMEGFPLTAKDVLKSLKITIFLLWAFTTGKELTQVLTDFIVC